MCLQYVWYVPRKNCGEVIKNACCSKLARRKKQGKQMVWSEIHQNGGRPGPRSGRIVRSELRSDCDRCTKPCDSSIRSALRSGSRSDRTIIAHDLPQDWVKLRCLLYHPPLAANRGGTVPTPVHICNPLEAPPMIFWRRSIWPIGARILPLNSERRIDDFPELRGVGAAIREGQIAN